MAFRFQSGQFQFDQTGIQGGEPDREAGGFLGGHAHVHDQVVVLLFVEFLELAQGAVVFPVDIGVVQLTQRGVAAGDRDALAFVDQAVAVVGEAAPAHAEFVGHVGAGDHHPGLDQHLLNRNVELLDQTTDFLKLGHGVLNDQRVGALIHGHRAAPADQSGAFAALGGDQRLELFGAGIVDADVLGAQRCQGRQLLLALQFLLFAGGDFVRRCHQQHIAYFALIQALGLEDQIQRLIPGHALQPQGDLAADGVGRHQVQIGEVGDQLQHRAHFDVLEIERQFLAGVFEGVTALPVLFRRRQRLDVDAELVVRLVGEIIPAAFRLNGDHGAAVHFLGVDELHRRGEIADVQAAQQIVFHIGAHETGHDTAALFAHIHRHGIVRQLHQHTALAVVAAPEINIADAGAARRRPALHRFAGRVHGRGGVVRAQGNNQLLAFDPRFIAGQLIQVEDQAGSLLGAKHHQAAHIPGAQIVLFHLDLVAGVEQIQRHPCRLLNAVALDLRRGALEGHAHFHAVTGQSVGAQVGHRRRSPQGGHAQPHQHQQQRRPTPGRSPCFC